MENNKYFIIDFDSTFTKVEALDELGEIALKDHPDKAKILQEITDLTNAGMEGKSSFSDNLTKRIDLLQANKRHLHQLIEKLKTKVSDFIKRNRNFFEEFSDNVMIVSSGFREFIEPIVTEYGVKKENIFANTFTSDQHGNLVGFDKENVLSRDKGKIEQLKKM